MTIRETLMSQYSRVPFTRVDGESRAFDWSKLTDEMIARAAAHGLKQKANDGLGAKELSMTERRAIFDKVLDAIESGTWGREREFDPLTRQITSLATVSANAHFKKLGIAVTKIPAADWKAKMAELRANPKIIAAAKAAVEALESIEV